MTDFFKDPFVQAFTTWTGVCLLIIILVITEKYLTKR